MRKFLAVAVLILVASAARAQTAPPTAVSNTPSLGQYQVGGGYSSVGGPTDNGSLLTFAKQFSNRGWGQAKTFLLANPSGVTIASVGPRYRFPWSAIKKPSGYFDSSKWFSFVDGNVGTVKDTTGAFKLAYGIGTGVDYQANSTLTLLIFEADYYRSSFFPSGGILVTNVHAVTSGLKISF